MLEPDLFSLFVAPIHDCGLSYMVSGSMASIVYGEPRATMDIDIAVLLSKDDLYKLAEIFPEEHYYLPPPEVLLVENLRQIRGHFNVIHASTGTKADFYPSRSHPYFRWALEHRRAFQTNGQTVYLAPPEYVILWKLEFFQEGRDPKHLRDIAGMLAVANSAIDQALLDQATVELGLTDCWKMALESNY